MITGAFSAGFLIPPFAALIPTVILAIKLDLFYTREFQMLFLPASALPLSVLLLTQFMRTCRRRWWSRPPWTAPGTGGC